MELVVELLLMDYNIFLSTQWGPTQKEVLKIFFCIKRLFSNTLYKCPYDKDGEDKTTTIIGGKNTTKYNILK